MPCHAAMIDQFVTVSLEEDVETVLKMLKKAGTDVAVVCSEDGKFTGLFKIQTLFKNLLPVSITMEDGRYSQVEMSAAPGIAKRLNKVHPLPVEQFVERRIPTVQLETQIWAGVKLLVDHGAPLVVLDEENGVPVGLMTMQTVLDELNRLKDS